VAVAAIAGAVWIVAPGGLLADDAPGAVSRMQSGELNPQHPMERTFHFTSRPFMVDQLFPSMKGPTAAVSTPILKSQPPELLWLRGYEMKVMGADGKTPLGYDYECHTNLNWPRVAAPGFNRPSGRAFTLTQGQVDVELPEGFGLPVMSNEQVRFITQVLNLNEPDANRQVRHRAEVRFVRDADLDEPLIPLVQTHATILASLEGEALVFGREQSDEHLEDDASCHAGLTAAGNQRAYKDKQGRSFTGHWIVDPGTHEYRTLVTDQMKIPYDTTAHFIGVHVHPYSKSLELRDLTTGNTVWKSSHESRTDGIGLSWIDYFSSREGLPIHAGHEYVLISVYENPTTEPSDAMATMFLYYHDKQFEAPSSSQSSSQEERRKGPVTS
jgi:hypothetical protein